MSLKSLLSTPLFRAAKVNESVYDGVILVTNCGKNVAETPQLKELSAAVLDFIEARLIRLEYVGEGTIENTYFLVGKGVTIDTGGIDLKTGGHMWGMCRDKYGSAVVAGFFKALELLKPKNIKVVGYMCMVRNSIGSHGYTTDEVLTARSGKRIHIYNTDAEGRITMLDPLTKAKEEDFDFHKAECEQAHLRQTGLKPSAQTLRGHQCPGAFMIMASRLDEHGCDSDHPLKFTHIDMGSAAGDHPETSFPNPLVTLVADLILPKHQ
ncbi:cytosol aminopeptidase family, catalytic domain protein [Teladorsagia circumcincta]|uniref:Cytosol aminopeptidase family, catalytic domain protein n=1 Tax=Teladorsagia circumcincta TaxID=45464 RepID=A0A2G9UBG4_TELCI|nr:cytosol aminopeptidase family, catalytic domain protein [Teladorsagia circumcincta]